MALLEEINMMEIELKANDFIKDTKITLDVRKCLRSE